MGRLVSAVGGQHTQRVVDPVAQLKAQFSYWDSKTLPTTLSTLKLPSPTPEDIKSVLSAEGVSGVSNWSKEDFEFWTFAKKDEQKPVRAHVGVRLVEAKVKAKPKEKDKYKDKSKKSTATVLYSSLDDATPMPITPTSAVGLEVPLAFHLATSLGLPASTWLTQWQQQTGLTNEELQRAFIDYSELYITPLYEAIEKRLVDASSLRWYGAPLRVDAQWTTQASEVRENALANARPSASDDALSANKAAKAEDAPSVSSAENTPQASATLGLVATDAATSEGLALFYPVGPWPKKSTLGQLAQGLTLYKPQALAVESALEGMTLKALPIQAKSYRLNWAYLYLMCHALYAEFLAGLEKALGQKRGFKRTQATDRYIRAHSQAGDPRVTCMKIHEDFEMIYALEAQVHKRCAQSDQASLEQALIVMRNQKVTIILEQMHEKLLTLAKDHASQDESGFWVAKGDDAALSRFVTVALNYWPQWTSFVGDAHVHLKVPHAEMLHQQTHQLAKTPWAQGSEAMLAAFLKVQSVILTARLQGMGILEVQNWLYTYTHARFTHIYEKAWREHYVKHPGHKTPGDFVEKAFMKGADDFVLKPWLPWHYAKNPLSWRTPHAYW